MWRSKTSRRDVLRGLGTLAGAGALRWIGCAPGNGGDGGNGIEEGTEPGGGGPGSGSPIVVRHDVMSTEGQAMLEHYRAAVGAMMQRGASDPTSWEAQANIHLAWCPHGNAYFLPWHRAYLHFFEQLIREASGQTDFALPYWDWTTHPTLPPAFWEGVLDDPTRRIAPDQPVPSIYVGADVIRSILDITDFETFASAYVTDACQPSDDGKEQRASCGTGRLEGTPHNNVHTTVGGRVPPVGNMSTFVSPLDPIFWLHHCNVDRLWAEWNLRHQNGTDATWRSFEFEGNFVDPGGTPQNIRVDQVFSTEDLGYRYGTIPAARPEGAAEPSAATVVAEVAATSSAAVRPGGAVSVPLALDEAMRRAVSGPAPEGAARTVRLTVGGIEQPSVALPLHVYLGPAERPTGGPESPHYLGTVSFFPIGEGAHEGHGGTASFLFDVGDQVGGADAAAALHVHVESVAMPAPEGVVLPAVTPRTFRLEVLTHG